MNPNLYKPIVSVVNTNGVDIDFEDTTQGGDSHWLSIVILLLHLVSKVALAK